MSVADLLYNLRSKNATMVQVANAIDGLASGRLSARVVTTTGTEEPTDEGIIFVNNTSDISRTLPAPSAAENKRITYIKISSEPNTCTINTPSGAIFQAVPTVLSRRGDYITFISNGVNYFVIDYSIHSLSSWTPTVTTSGSMGITTTLINGRFKEHFGKVDFYLRLEGSLSATLSNTIFFTLPVTASSSVTQQSLNCRIVQPGQYTENAICFNNSTTQVSIFRESEANYLSGAYQLVIQGFYFI